MSAPIVLVGGGLASQRCAEGLRRGGWDGRIQIVCAETTPPYDRPPLSKDLASEAARFRDDAWYSANGIELLLGERAVVLDAPSHELELSSGARLRYAKALIATGADPIVPPPMRDVAHVMRTIDDNQRLAAQLRPGTRLAVVGAGVLGLEVAATARTIGSTVTAFDIAPVPLARLLPPAWGRWLEGVHRDEGVEFRLGAPAEIDGHDVVVAAVGVRPATGWLDFVEPGQPVSVDERCQTALPDVFAAGDVAACAGQRTEHWEAAVREGMTAARGMLGLPVPPPAPHSFWTDQYGMRIQLIGDHEGADQETVDGDPAARDFAVTWRHEGRMTGALLVNRPRELPAVRRLIENQHEPQGDNVVLQG
jgi:3-phenylpropionate/trans-cinnamate dioxygenase ferredoxin reductase subunit